MKTVKTPRFLGVSYSHTELGVIPLDDKAVLVR